MTLVEPLARVLCSADGLDPDARERGAGPLWEHYQTQAALILAALAEAGVLVEQWGHYNPSVGDVRIDEDEAEARAMVEFWDDPDTCRVVHRYVTDWQEVQA